MKKNSRVFTGIIVAMLVLSASVAYALSTPIDESSNGSAEPVQGTVSVHDTSVPLTGTVDALTNSTNIQEHGFSISEFSPISTQSADVQIISQEAAITAATNRLEAMTSSTPSTINAVLASFTDNELVSVPETGGTLQNVPAWIITFQDVTITAQGNGASVLADSTVVIDAYTGEILEVISYSV